ncbi:hypothetical protein [Flavobacterium aquidurense]|uniref:Lipoprotein n=1 Tax=Flavobacterium aquidurense TaxID=362413 RepID=A0A0Q0S4I3_9FLAO|nr:hypothetical protein [Flavobacterium aquidurense]KQB40394.1 hypothetical protein RC62_284 [Flavobacterium aquidurense]
MKKRILLVAVLQLFMVLGSCSSDSGDDSTSNSKKEIIVDYVANVSYTVDFVINDDNTAYQFGNSDAELKKIDSEGKITSLNKFADLLSTGSKLSVSKSGEILLISPFNNGDYDKIYRFEKNFSELNPFYTMKAISSPFAAKIRLYSICNNNDNTYFVFDYGNKQIKRYLPELGSDVFVAGSEKNEIKDGTGLNAGFSTVSRIISQNNVLYLIDNLDQGNGAAISNSSIRKLEYVNNEWKVTTLTSTATETYIDIAFDSKNELYVLVKNKGISKLNLQNNTLSTFKEGQLEFKKENTFYGFPSASVKAMKIKGNTMYLASDNELVKISDFQTKFAATEK